MEPSRSAQYGLSAGIGLAGSLAAAGLYVFTTEDAVRLAPLGVGPERVRPLLKSLADAGWITRLRRGLYAGTGRLPGGVDVPPFVIATSLVTPSAISHLSALAFHDLTDQVPLVITASTPRKVVTPTMRHGAREEGSRHVWRVDGVECRFVTVIARRFELGLETVWLEERFAVRVTDRERTILDLFAMPRIFGGINEGLSVLERSRGDIDFEKLVDYAVRFGSIAVGKRLGWALQEAGAKPEALTPLLELPATSYSPLDPGRARRGPRDPKWHVIVNLNQYLASE